ncbi:MAG: hypothetical protein ING66_08010 [Rhodocyclaceae bacterium]|nr:hypothetical protein [Rhodocyclaceae bacterium]MCE2723124.1 hypothetical protein [Betaproteobacteria bacterium]MCA3026185.1 hypothetical protein [Rhodocyclaceae bacterium]MCA3028529.1 hypothetical protein [Rhodocyclaceae bacterium]MCA3034036.1 hypothetical protein [Rhodocyclaceae bacterium]
MTAGFLYSACVSVHGTEAHFTTTRHSREGGNPISFYFTTVNTWIPAFAGMTASFTLRIQF